jgi:hypothetical protein
VERNSSEIVFLRPPPSSGTNELKCFRLPKLGTEHYSSTIVSLLPVCNDNLAQVKLSRETYFETEVTCLERSLSEVLPRTSSSIPVPAGIHKTR